MRDAHQDATLQLGWRKTSRRRWQASSSALWHEHPKNVAKFEKGCPLRHKRRVRRAQARDAAHPLADRYATASALSTARAVISAPRNASSTRSASRALGW